MSTFDKLRRMKTRVFFVTFGIACTAGAVMVFYACLQLNGEMCWHVPPIV